MPAHRRLSSHAGRRSPRRRTAWARTNAALNIAAVNQETTIDLLATWRAAGGTQQAVTIGRTHLRVSPLGGVPVVGNALFIALMRGQSNDVGANIAGAPNPSVDLNEDYLLWDLVQCDPTGALVPGGSAQLQYDIKSMRKLNQLEQSYNLVCSSTGWTAFPLNLRVSASVLLLLP
jgi:hypothetical protein